MSNLIGMMQGRLSYPAPPRLQVFPFLSWEKEFANARSCGFDLIEWLFTEDESYAYTENPLWIEAGRQRIRNLIDESGIQVHTCCAHYFMNHPFFRVTEEERLASVAVLKRLVLRAAHAGIKTILIPVLESCELRTEDEKSLLLSSLREPLRLAQQNGVKLALEMELPAEEYRALLVEAGHPALGAYYDAGNNNARGFDIVSGVRSLGPYLFGVHIKDRRRGGPSVMLGHGDTDFKGFFQALKEAGYLDPIILETPLGSDVLQTAQYHLAFVRRFLDA